MIDPKITIDIEGMRQRFGVLAEKLPAAVVVAVRSSVLLGVRYVVKMKLTGQALRRRTGTLIRSVTASPRVELVLDNVVGSFGSNLDYARAHELGFHGRVQVRAHSRRRAIYIARKRLKKGARQRVRDRATTIASADSYRETLASPTASSRERSSAARQLRELRGFATRSVSVRAHHRRVDIKAKHMFRDTLRAITPGVRARISKSFEYLARDGKVPKLSDVGYGAGGSV